MYETHPYFNHPPDDTVLWRYMDFTKFISLLDTSCLFLARTDTLGDPFEGALTDADMGLLDSYYSELDQKTWIRVAKAMRRNALISCWCENSSESDAMWRLYSRKKNGIAIKTVFSSFKESMTDERYIHVGRIKYIDYENDFAGTGNVFKPFLCKRRAFEHEQEVRAVHIHMPDGPYAAFSDAGMCYQVDLSLLIQEVIVAPCADDWFLELVKSVVARYKLEAPVNKSEMDRLPAWVR
ncbi:hypothetical protein C6502_01270 [Candidatus Poribacteria bacterium]|nr:MAG: hypothetical protein C6502_01270 [Candidatus Poribacteria bacterium]